MQGITVTFVRRTISALAFVLAGSGAPAFAANASPASTAGPGTLSHAVETAVLTHPEIQARFNDFISTLEGQEIARGAMRPQVSAQGWVGKEWRSGNSDVPPRQWNRPGYSLELRQLLFDGMSTANLVRQNGFEKLAAYYDLLATIDSVASETAGAYLDVQRYREMERLARENFAVHQSTLGLLQERQDSGVGRGVDFQQARGRLALAQSNLMTESNNLNDVTQRYQRLVGVPPAPTLLKAADVKTALPDEPKNFLESVRSNPGILARQAQYRATEYGIQAAQGRNMPTVELRAASGTDREQPGIEYRNVQNSSVQLNMSYRLYSGGADQAGVRQSKARSFAARDMRDHTCRNLQQDLSIAWNAIMLLQAQMPFLLQHEKATSSVRTAYMQQFQIGERTLMDLLDTENELFDSRRALVNAQYDLKKAQLQWLALSHRLLPTLGLSDPYKNQPPEAKRLELSDESLKACLAPAPDTRNLAPVSVKYQDGMLPPIIEKP